MSIPAIGQSYATEGIYVYVFGSHGRGYECKGEILKKGDLSGITSHI